MSITEDNIKEAIEGLKISTKMTVKELMDQESRVNVLCKMSFEDLEVALGIADEVKPVVQEEEYKLELL